MKKNIIFLVIFGLILPSFSFAQNALPFCDFAQQNLTVGFTDSNSNGRVSGLQNYLVGQGYLVMPIGVQTGYFGPLTRTALAKFQASVGINPPAGYYGPITRTYINARCGQVNNQVNINSLSPTYGPIGTPVTINGSGFSQSGNTVNFGNGIVKNLSSANGNSITFNVPDSISPPCTYLNPPCLIPVQILVSGTYKVSVSNSSGIKSNEMNFTVTNNTISDSGPVINSVSTPTYLQVNQTGTWTVSATDTKGGNLTYSVDWGDQANCPPNLVCSPSTRFDSATSIFQQSTSFTHSYSSPGTHTQTFTVRNSSGQEAQSTTNVQVTSTAPGIY